MLSSTGAAVGGMAVGGWRGDTGGVTEVDDGGAGGGDSEGDECVTVRAASATLSLTTGAA